MTLMRNLFRDLKSGENLDLYVALALAIVFVGLSVLGVGAVFIPPLTLTLLALVSVALLRLFHRIEMLVNPLESRPIMATIPDVADKIETAKEIWISGIAQNSLLTSICEILSNRQAGEFKLKVLLADPDGHAIGMSIRRHPHPVSVEYERSGVFRALERASHLARLNKSVEIKVLDYLFPEAFLFFEPTQRSGQLYVKYYTFQTRGGQSRPREVFSPSSPWYQLHCTQFQKMWEVAESWPKNSDVVVQ